LKHYILNLWFLNINISMSEWICPKRQKKRRLVYVMTAWTDEFHFIKHSRKGNKFAFCEFCRTDFSINRWGDVTKHVGTANPFFHGCIILYLKFWLHRFYIQNAAECTILHPSEKKTPPLPLLVSRGLACMKMESSQLKSSLL
jgi:hypothetical protein